MCGPGTLLGIPILQQRLSRPQRLLANKKPDAEIPTIRARLPPTLARHPTFELTAWPPKSILAPLASGMSYRQQ